ncbi:prolipoprotein diacylglyceryl transferase [Pandoraea fibrosis]|uniref:Phosphatidylglycerol--prolipoprotein diacylglyceryl transferase n=1 Tax=Pandoraea fibrosis TaxID=1891094 RepID=A0A5E4V8W4_9BURK|nr:prolipoprotein diacylglyceryl transferase [Pandoraea fibrosis]QHE91411.1 prolipoprotein diacylglyceryl transferase [Pandoraea fibrosis]QHF15031.1 prolipoprotein diacylglyceryl transferase [Pandoraea fibrosis]VVE08707.1 prolipoprotein diacylglyceryl transferase [Pandoraea fibrosis]
MLIHPQFDPVAIHLGPLAIRWYGLMYLVGFILFLLVGRLRVRQPSIAKQGWKAQDLDDMLFYGVLGVILGGRLGYVIFYKLSFYLANPLDVFKVWEGGMSFHGGFLGVLVAMWLFTRRRGHSLLEGTDLIAPMIPLGLAAGRLGNFINGELWGRVTSPDSRFAMLFPQAAAEDAQWMLAHPQAMADQAMAMVFAQFHGLPRYPSQLFEFALEGVALFLLLWFFARRARPVGAVSGMFLVGYGAFRFLAEFTREPDAFLGLLSFGLSMGQWLSLPMVVAGVIMLVWSYRRQPATSHV